VTHVEGGIRSGDWSMPEEINRLVTDSITNWFFTTSEFANDNIRLLDEGRSRRPIALARDFEIQVSC
jgi:UDP-N-acetylglucosamine 2-epimerase (non-hydrolysing)